MREYEEGVHWPKMDVARYNIAVLNPGEALEAHRQYCYVFRADYKGVLLVDYIL